MKTFLFAAGIIMATPVFAHNASALGNAPLFFAADASSQFSARGSDCAFSISPDQSQIILENAERTATVQMQFPGANPSAKILGENELPGKINYLVGAPSQWHSGVPIFSKARVAQIYPGIDLIYHGNQKRLEYDFEISPGANPAAIQIHFAGAQKLFVNACGELVLKIGDGEMIQPAPEIFQNIGGKKNFISGGYKILDAHTISFAVGNYDHSLPLVIDPTIAFSTYFGGTGADTAWSVALGADGSIYEAGGTLSKRFSRRGPKYYPFSTDGAFQETFGGGKLTGDGFLAKFDSTGTNLVYLTYLGGNKDEYISSVVVDAIGDAYVAGFTTSTNFPVTNAVLGQIAGTYNRRAKAFPEDAFVAELDPSGSNLIYSTYLGGNGSDSATAIAIDSSGDAYVTGITDSTNFPVVNPLHFNSMPLDHLMGTNNAFVAEIAPGGSSLLFSSYLGGSYFDVGEGIAVDTNGNIYISGFTDSTNFPTTTNHIVFTNQLFGVTNRLVGSNVVDGHLLNSNTGLTNFSFDAFVTKLQPSGADFVYSTLLGGSRNDYGYRVACDNDGNAYVVGYSTSTNFPNTTVTNVVAGLHSFDATNRISSIVDEDAFLTKIGPGGTNIVYSALFGGRGNDVAYGVALDNSDDVYVTGYTQSADFPTNNPLTYIFDGSTNVFDHISGKRGGRGYHADVFVTVFNSDCSALVYSTYFGGENDDYGYDIAVDPATGDAFIVGSTDSKKFPTVDAGQDLLNGRSDSFLFEIQP